MLTLTSPPLKEVLCNDAVDEMPMLEIDAPATYQPTEPELDDEDPPPIEGKLTVAWTRCQHGTNDQDKWVVHARCSAAALRDYIPSGWDPRDVDFTSTYGAPANNAGWEDARNQYFECIRYTKIDNYGVVNSYIVFSCKHDGVDALIERYPFLGPVRSLNIRFGRKDEYANDWAIRNNNGLWRWAHAYPFGGYPNYANPHANSRRYIP